MKRQGLITTIGELRCLADELEAQVELNKLEVIKDSGWNSKFQLNIINKSGLSDEWEFEKDNSHPTKQTIQKGRGDVLNKDLDSVRSVESKTDDVIMTGCPDEMEELFGNDSNGDV